MLASRAVCEEAHRDLLRTARRLARSAEDARDLVQDALVIALASGLEDWSSPARRPWLRGVIRKRAAFLARGQLRRRRREALAEPAAAPVPGFLAALAAGGGGAGERRPLRGGAALAARAQRHRAAPAALGAAARRAVGGGAAHPARAGARALLRRAPGLTPGGPAAAAGAGAGHTRPGWARDFFADDCSQTAAARQPMVNKEP